MSQATRPDTTIPTRRALLAGAPAVAAAALAGGTVANALAIAEAKAAEADPIFAVIAEHRSALKAVDAALKQSGPEEDDATDAAQEREMAAELALWTTAPTTLYGVVLLLAYIGEADGPREGETILGYAHNWQVEDLSSAVWTFPQHLATTLVGIIGPDELLKHQSAELKAQAYRAAVDVLRGRGGGAVMSATRGRPRK